MTPPSSLFESSLTVSLVDVNRRKTPNPKSIDRVNPDNLNNVSSSPYVPFTRSMSSMYRVVKTNRDNDFVSVRTV